MDNKKVFMRDMTWMEYIERVKTDIVFLELKADHLVSN